jgi:hypothetical protein
LDVPISYTFQERDEMANNQKPGMTHQVVSFDPNGTRRVVPQPNQWSAEAEAKRRVARGHSNVEVQSWDSDTKQFIFNVTANNHLIEQDNRVSVDEDALEALGKLASSQRSMYKAASSGKASQAEVSTFVGELLDLARLLDPEGMEELASTNSEYASNR